MTDTVMALVLTHDAPDALDRCLAALDAQVQPPDATLVVDNASAPPVRPDRGDVAAVLRLDENLGPAGGYAAGLAEFLRGPHEWVWVLDDDVRAEPAALAAQLRAARAHPEPTVVQATMVDDASGAEDNTQGWCAVLIPREIVATVGLPDAALFWWTEDTEYLQWRIPRAGYRVERCDDARVHVSRARASPSKPAWKYYYETRNQVHYRLHTQRPAPGEPVLPHLTRRVRTGRALRAAAKLAGRAVLREPDHRTRKVWMVARGSVDGVRGRLGRTVVPDTADRPVAAATPTES